MLHKYITLISLVSVLIMSSPAYALNSTSDEEYNSVIKQAREGNHEHAKKLLAKLINDYPDELKYRYDYVTILAWAELDAEAHQQLPYLDLKTTPIYVLEALAKSSRNTKHFNDAEVVYRSILEKSSQHRQSQLGLALTLADAKRGNEAQAFLNSLPTSNNTDVELLQTKAYVYESQRDHFNALLAHEAILAVAPQKNSSIRSRLLNISRIGAPQLALELAQENPGVLSDRDIAEIKNEHAALLTRWGRLETVTPLHRHANTDSAINLLLESLDEQKDKRSSTSNRLNFDLLVAYRDRGLMSRSVAIYEGLQSHGVPIPPYALSAAGDAYLQLKEPEKALPLLQKSLALNPHDIDTSSSLFYALLATEQHDNAIKHIDTIADNRRSWIASPDGKGRTWNPEKMQLDIMASLSRAYTGDLKEGQRRLTKLVKTAPNNTQIKSELANIYLWRGWPRRARSEFLSISAQEPQELGPKLGVIRTELTMGAVTKAEKSLFPILAMYPDEPSVLKLNKDIKVRQMRELSVYGQGGEASSVPDGSRDFRLDSYYYDTYFNKYFRPFVHAYYQQADVPHTTSYQHYSAGLAYSSLGLSSRVEIGADSDKAGVSASAEWNINDFWSLNSALDTNSKEVPLKARVDDVSGKSASIGLSYRFHERRQLNASLSTYKFSDGNTRSTQYISAQQRLLTYPTYLLDASLSFYQQSNSATGTNYFNPKKTSTTEITFKNEWQTFKRYERVLRQRLFVSLGSTSQKGYSDGSIWNLSYEHEWDINRRLSIGYGISYGKSMYDGELEETRRGFMMINKRFK